MRGNLIIGKNNSFYNINNNLIKVNINGNRNKVLNPFKIIDLYIHGNNNTIEVIGIGQINNIKFFGNNNKIHFKNNFQPHYTDLGIGNEIIKPQPQFFPLPSNRIIFQPLPLPIFNNQNLMINFNNGSNNIIDKRENDFLQKLKENLFSEVPPSLKNNSKECFLCKKPFTENEIRKIFSCNKHIFHKECLKDWIKTNINSPICPKCDQLSLNITATPFTPLFHHNTINHTNHISFPRPRRFQRPLYELINNINDNHDDDDDEDDDEDMNDDNFELNLDNEDDDGIYLDGERGLNKLILDNMVISKIKDIDKLDNDKKKCTICLENYLNGDDSIALPCIHIFHAECIKTWLKNHNNCPICKHKIDDHDIFEEDEIYD